MPVIKGATTSRGWYAFLEYTITGQDIAANKSTISFTLKVHDGTGSSRNEVPNEAYYQMPGRSKTYKTYNFPSTGDYTIASSTVTVNHNSDGTGSYAAAALWCSENETTYTPYSLSVSGTISLPTIPRASVPTAERLTMYLGESVNIYTNSKSARFYHRIGCVFGNYTHWGKSIFDADIAKSQFVFSPPVALAEQIPNSPRAACTIMLTTYSDAACTKQVGAQQTMTITLTVPTAIKPTAELRLTPVPGDNVPAAWGSPLIYGIGKLQYEVDATGAYGSTIESVAFSFAGQSLAGDSGMTDVIKQTGEIVPICTVTDTRGRSATIQGDPITVYEHTEPTMDPPAAYRCNVYGVEDDEGTYIRVLCSAACSSIGGRNSVSLQVRTREATGDFGQYIPLQNGVAKILSGYSSEHSFVVEIMAVDAVGAEKVVTPPPIPTAEWAFKIGRGGRSAAFGKAPEEDDLLDVAWNQRVRKNLQIDGALSVGGLPLVDIVHPVGSIYISKSPTDPSELFGGTWEQVKDTFILTAGDKYAAGSTGGEETHTLTENEMPRHRHSQLQANNSGTAGTWVINAGTTNTLKVSYSSGAIGYTGGGQPHNNMPPYLVVYAWERTA